MKRFFIIFAICFASVIGIMGGIFGVKYLKGDFNKVIINPNNISFELDEYDVTGDFKMTITTTTEDVNATKVTLTFAKGTNSSGNGVNTYGKDHLTDGVIIIPKEVTLNVPFEIKLCKTNDGELNNLEWIKGGISNLVATSECKTTPKATTKVYVDVPVYKTEIVIFDGRGTIDNTSSLKNTLTYIEGQTNLLKKLKTDEDKLSFNAGDTFYLGLKFYPERSAYKYSKATSTNMLVEYYDAIISKMNELNLNYESELNTLKSLLKTENATKEIDFQELINAYQQIVNLKDASLNKQRFTEYLKTLNESFKKNLKYYTYEEKIENSKANINKIERVDGTNLYKLQAVADSTSLSNLVNVELYSYTFYNSKIENDTVNASEDYSTLLGRFETMYTEQGESLANKKVDKQTKQFNIVDVDVDTIAVNGGINDFLSNKIHTIYASKDGTNTSTTSYLKLALSNSNIDAVNLQNKILNIGIRFEKRLSSSSWGETTELKFVDSDNYTKVKVIQDDSGAYTYYYLPIGNKANYNDAYWQVYSDEYIANDFRAVLVYIKSYELNADNEFETDKENVKVVVDNPIFRLSPADSDEKLVKWTSLDNLTLGVVDMTGVLDLSATDLEDDGSEKVKNVSYNKEIDLSKLVSIPETNNFQTYKFFIYSDDEQAEQKLSAYFATVDANPKPYTLKGVGITKNLYELDGSILKLKRQEIPNYSVNVMFATIRTGALRNPIMVTNGEYEIYDIVKYSAVKDNSLVENLSSLTINFTNSLKTIKAELSDLNTDYAGVANEDAMFKMAQNTTDVLTFKISGGEGDETKLRNAFSDGSIRMEARESKSNATNYITYRLYQDVDSYYIIVSSAQVTKNVTVRLYLVYTVDGNDYMFPVNIVYNYGGNTTFYTVTIVENTNSEISFDFETVDNTSIMASEIDYILVSTVYDKASNKYSKTYNVYYRDTSFTEHPTVKIFGDDTRVKVKIVDFLGNVVDNAQDGWYLKSSNLNVLVVQNDQYVNFVGETPKESPAVLSLYAGSVENSTLSEKVNFVVENSGRVEEVIKYYKDPNQKIEFKYDETIKETYKFPTQSMSLESSLGDEVVLSNLLIINYKLDDSINPLTMGIYVANEASLNVLQQISNTTLTKENYKTTPITSFVLNKMLGSVVKIDLSYVCKELDITQSVSLKLNQVFTIKKVDIKNASGVSITKTDSNYNIYKGIPYTVEIETENVSNTKNLYYYSNGEEKKAFTVTDNKYSFNFTFSDSSLSSRQIYITSTNSDDENEKIGELVYCLEFNVLENLIINVKNSTVALKGNKVTIPFVDLMGRKNVSGTTLENYPLIYTNISFDAKTEYAKDNEKLSISIPKVDDSLDAAIKERRCIDLTFSNFTNEATVKFYIVIDEIIVGLVTLKVVPENLINAYNYFAMYKGVKAIVVSNSEVISGDNDRTNLFTDLFRNEEGVQVVYDSTFNGTYTNINGTVRKVTLSNNNLFTNTDTFVTVTKDGISTKYLIVISRLKFPFVKFENLLGEELAYANLDIYRLFENTENLYDYYKANNINFFTTTQNTENGKQEIELIKNNENLVYLSNDSKNIFNATNLGILEMATGENVASSYAMLQTEEEGIKLVANPIGVLDGVYIKASLNLAQAGTNTYFAIPTIIHLKQTQKLLVSYPNSGEVVELNENNYGSEVYDELMQENQLPFSNRLVEYLSFNEVYSNAELDLSNNKYTRLIVKEIDSSQDFATINYTGVMHYSIEKIVKNVSGVWSVVDKNDFANYASITVSNTGAILTVNKYMGLNVVRLKIKVTTDGGAENYIYVSAGEAEQLTLMRQTSSSTPISIGDENNISLKSEESILIGNGVYDLLSSNSKYYYYLTNINYNQELKFRLIGTDGSVVGFDSELNTFVSVDSNKLTIKVQPTGAYFVIELYTVYGVLTKLNISVESAFKFTLKELNIYSGTSYLLTDLVDFSTNIESLNGFAITNIENKENNKYFVCDGGKLVFTHIDSKVAFNLVLTITIEKDADTYVFNATFKNIVVLPRIESLYPNQTTPYVDLSTGTDSEPNLTNKTVDSGKVTLSKKLWSKLFKDNKLGNEFTITEFAENNKLYYFINTNLINENADIDYEVGGITSTITSKVQFSLAIKNNDDSYTTIAKAFVMLTINPQYKLTVNYPITYSETGEETTFGYEIIQNKGTIDFSTKTFNNLDRLIVTNMVRPEQTVTYTIKLNDVEIPSAGQYSFDFDDTDFVQGDIVQYFDIYINDLKYGSYVVYVTKDSPMSFTQSTKTIYASYGDDDVFKNVDVIVTMPKITLADGKEKVSLYVASQAGVTNNVSIASNIYYRAGEKVRCILPISKYEQGISRVFVATDGTSVSTTDTECNAIFSIRGTLTYNGNKVRYKDYDYIISSLSLRDEEITSNSKEFVKSLEKSAVCSIISDKTIASSCSITLTYDIAFDEDLLNKTRVITLNANEKEEGYSFVDLFGLKDTLGNKFWLNHTNNSKEISVKIIDNISSINCMPVTPILKDNIRYDYNLKPLGASNDGTKVTIKFTYTLGENRVYSAEFDVIVKSDIEFVVHNESTASINSEYNPLMVVYSEDILLASEAQTAFIYAYSKYSTIDPKPNVVIRWSDPQVSGDKSYFTVVKENGGIYLKFNKEATFGNKNIVITFTDPYNFTFKYYIEFVASSNVVSYNTDSKKVYEGETFDVYNRNKDYGTNMSGVGLVIKNGNDTDIQTELKVTSLRFLVNGTTYSIFADINEGLIGNTMTLKNGRLSLKYLSFTDIWNNSLISNGLSLSGTLEVNVVSATPNTDGSYAYSIEEYSFSIPFTIYKKYRTSLSAENTFVRENVEINLEHFIDVYDYSKNSYLGKPELNEYEAYKATFKLDNIQISTDKKTLLTYLTGKLELINKNLDIINNTTTSEDDKIKAETENEGLWIELKKFGVIPGSTNINNKYDITNLKITLLIRAKNKATSNVVTYQGLYDITLDGSIYKVDTFLELGSDSSPLGAGVNLLNYNIEHWLYDLTSYKQVTAYSEGSALNTGLVANNSSSGKLYRVDITISDNVNDGIELMLYDNKKQETTSIKEYTNIGDKDSTTLSRGKHSFYLYNKVGQDLSLFTGIDKNGTKYVNGLTLIDVCKAKNLSYKEDKTFKIKPTLNGAISLTYDSTYKVPYQVTSTDELEIKFKESEKSNNSDKYGYLNATESKSYNLYVTPKYTGIDTSLAYATSIHYCYDVNFESKLDGNGALSNDESNIGLSTWAQDFKLITGVGVSAVLAQGENKDLYGENITGTEKVQNVSSLYFEAGNVFDTSSGDKTSEGKTIFTVDSETGDLTLKQGFIPNDYYISVRVFCKYGSKPNIGKVELGTVYVQFVSVENRNVRKVNPNDDTSDEYSFDIPDSMKAVLGSGEIAVNRISLGSIKVVSCKNGTLTVVNNNAIENGKVYNLVIDNMSKLVRLNVMAHNFAVENITISSDGRSFSADNILVKLLNESVKIKEYLTDKGITFTNFTITLQNTLDSTKTYKFKLDENGENFVLIGEGKVEIFDTPTDNDYKMTSPDFVGAEKEVHLSK